jgi:hypothetical protein
VAEFAISGAPNNKELKQSLQGILASRLNPDLVSLVETPEQADLLVLGSYALFGKMFSMDVLIKDKKSGTAVKVFEQGEGDEAVIPAVGRLAKRIDAELLKQPVGAAAVLPAPSPAPSPSVVKEAYMIPAEPSVQDAPGSWSSAPLDGTYTSIAVGRTLPTGERELYIANEQTLRAYLVGKELRQVAEIAIPSPGKLLAVDSADLDKDGTVELYVSIIDRGKAASRVYQLSSSSFVLVADKLPWFFRGIGSDITSRKIYAQGIKNGGKYYGTVRELAKSAAVFTTKEPQKLPQTGTIFNFNRLSGASAGSTVVLDEDGYLTVYGADGSEAWKSSEKFGGSESYFNNQQRSYSRTSNDLQRWSFLEQRMTLLRDGTLLVPRNEGTFSFGNNRSFDKYTLIALEWTGAVFKEKWHTRTSPGYLADYAFDQASGELFLLEVVKKSGLFSSGKSVITINKLQ